MNGELEVLKRPVEIKNEGLNLEINLFGQPRSHYEHTFVPL